MTLTTQAQHVNFQLNEDGDYYYHKTYVIDSATSNELINKSKSWLHELFNVTTGYELLKYEVVNSDEKENTR